MKFGKQILMASSSSKGMCTEEMWLDYKRLKKLIKSIPESLKGKSMEEKDQEQLLRSSEDERRFFLMLRRELKKVANSYKQLEHQGLQKLISLKGRYNRIISTLNVGEYTSLIADCINVHMNLLMLENYAVLNYAGFTKILKKHDKVTGFRTKEQFLLRLVNSEPFAVHPWLRSAISNVESQFKVISSLASREASTSASAKQGATVTSSNLDILSNAADVAAKGASRPAGQTSAEQTEQLLALIESVATRTAENRTKLSELRIDEILNKTGSLKPQADMNHNRASTRFGSVPQDVGNIPLSFIQPLAHIGKLETGGHILPDIVLNSTNPGIHKQLFQLHSALEQDQSKDWLRHALNRASMFQGQTLLMNKKSLTRERKEETENNSDCNTSAEEDDERGDISSAGTESKSSNHPFSLSRTLDTLAVLAQERMKGTRSQSPVARSGDESISPARKKRKTLNNDDGGETDNSNS